MQVPYEVLCTPFRQTLIKVHLQTLQRKLCGVINEIQQGNNPCFIFNNVGYP